MDTGSGRTSAELRQPIYQRPNSTSYQPGGAQAFRGGHRSFVPGHGSQPMMRPGSTNTGASQLYPQMVPTMMTPQSPPVHNQAPQPVMMQSYGHPMPVSPNPMGEAQDMSGQNMMRMQHNQSPYYQQMPAAPQPGYPGSGMASPGMMQPNNTMYHPSMGTQYRPVPRKGVPPQNED